MSARAMEQPGLVACACGTGESCELSEGVCIRCGWRAAAAGSADAPLAPKTAFHAAPGSLSLGQITTGAETGTEWEAERAELRAAVKWGYDMIKALVNHAGGEVVLQKETCETRGRLEVIPRGDQIYVRCWKGMDQ